jgi:hypothetical protein
LWICAYCEATAAAASWRRAERTHLKRVGRVLVEHRIASVLLLGVKLALQLAHTDLHAIGSGAAAMLHVAVEEARCGGEPPVEDVDTDGKAGVELGHFDVKPAALVGGNKAELDFASSGVIWPAHEKECEKCISKNGGKKQRRMGRE